MGLGSCALEDIAQQAGMKRSILRHYIGNRDDIIVALGKRWVDKYDEQWQTINAYLPPDDQSEYLLHCLFDYHSDDHANQVVIGEALFGEAKRLPDIRAQQNQITEQFLEHTTAMLHTDYPDANDEALEHVSCGVHAIYLTAESLRPAQMTHRIDALKAAAWRLVQTLD